MAHFAVTAVGVDRPGIVAAVTGALAEAGCNLEDTSSSILRGHFAMVLVVSSDADLAAVEEALRPAAELLGLVVTVRAIEEVVGAAGAGDPWTLSVYGADHPGIVASVARLLADLAVNITDLTTRVIGDADRPVYAMVLEVSVPAGVGADDFVNRLHALGRQLGVDCTAHRSDADIL